LESGNDKGIYSDYAGWLELKSKLIQAGGATELHVHKHKDKTRSFILIYTASNFYVKGIGMLSKKIELPLIYT
jgi:hypothetical protein